MSLLNVSEDLSECFLWMFEEIKWQCDEVGLDMRSGCENEQEEGGKLDIKIVNRKEALNNEKFRTRKLREKNPLESI